MGNIWFSVSSIGDNNQIFPTLENKYSDETFQESACRRMNLANPNEDRNKVLRILTKISDEVKKDFPALYKSHNDFLDQIKGLPYPPQNICLDYQGIGCSKSWALHRAHDSKIRIHCCGYNNNNPPPLKLSLKPLTLV